jgi:WD40 repeat protein
MLINANYNHTGRYSLIKAILLLVSITTLNGLYAQELVLTMINTGNPSSVTSVCFSSDGKYILSGSYEKSVKLWDIGSGKEIRPFVGHKSVITSVCFSPDGKTALSGSCDCSMILWDVATSKKIRAFAGHLDMLYQDRMIKL